MQFLQPLFFFSGHDCILLLEMGWPPTASLVAQMVKNLPAMQAARVQSLGQEDPLEKGMTTHSKVLAWRIPWTEEPGWATVHGLTKSDSHSHFFTFLRQRTIFCSDDWCDPVSFSGATVFSSEIRASVPHRHFSSHIFFCLLKSASANTCLLALHREHVALVTFWFWSPFTLSPHLPSTGSGLMSPDLCLHFSVEVKIIHHSWPKCHFMFSSPTLPLSFQTCIWPRIE